MEDTASLQDKPPHTHVPVAAKQRGSLTPTAAGRSVSLGLGASGSVRKRKQQKLTRQGSSFFSPVNKAQRDSSETRARDTQTQGSCSRSGSLCQRRAGSSAASWVRAGFPHTRGEDGRWPALSHCAGADGSPGARDVSF